MKKFYLLHWVFLFLGSCASGRVIQRPLEKPGETLVRIERALKNGEFSKAEALLDYLSGVELKPTEEERYLFLYAYFYFKQNELWDSFLKLKELSSSFPITIYAPQVAWMEFQIGKTLLHTRSGFLGIISNHSYGVRVLKHLSITWPTQTEPGNPGNVLADDALAILGDDAWKDRDWEKVEEYYSKLLQFYPDSEWNELALFRIGMSWFYRIQGPPYDMYTMKRAEKELALFLGKDVKNKVLKQKAGKALQKVRDCLAERNFLLAEYYITVGSPYGAYLYLKEICDSYPGSKWAEKAKRMLPEWRKKAEDWKKKKGSR